MSTSISALETVLGLVWRASWQASILAAIVLLIQFVLGKRLGAGARYALWAVVVIRLLLPVAPQSRLSLFNLARTSKDSTPGQRDVPKVPVIDPVNPTISAVSSAKPQAAGRAADVVRAGDEGSTWSLRSALPFVWVGGIVVMSIWVTVSCRRLGKLLRQLVSVTDPTVLDLVASSAATLRLRRHPAVVTGQAVVAPAVVGLIRPTLMLPTRVLDCCDRRELRLIILHELAHLKRRDILANWVMTAATIIHWFNPLVWLIAARVRADRELACDEMVLARSRDDGDAQAYGHTLLKLIEILSPPPPRAAQRQLVGILGSPTPMQRRVRMIAQFDPRGGGYSTSSTRWIWTLMLLGALGCTALTDAVHGDNGAMPAAARTASATTRPSNISQAPPATDLRDALAKVVPEVTFEGVPLKDVVEFLRQQSGLNMVVNWKALEAAGIDGGAAITLRLHGATLDEVLERVLKDAGGGTVRLEYAIDRSAIVISTEEDLAYSTQTVFYEVSDLMVDPQGHPLAGEAFDKKAEDLMKILQDTVAIDTWKDNGGNVGSINRFNGKLIVVQTAKNQQQIEHILAKLRENPPIVVPTTQASR